MMRLAAILGAIGRSGSGRKRRLATVAALAGAALNLAACVPAFDFGPLSETQPPAQAEPYPQGEQGPYQQMPPGQDWPPSMPAGGQASPVNAGTVLGNGPVRVAMLLPLTGEANLVDIGTSMANAARLAMSFVEASPTLGDNITLEILDTGGTNAAQQAQAALRDGVSLILGPLSGDQVIAAGQVARAAGIPLLGFSNNPGAAAPGVYLLAVLPRTEIARSFSYVGRKGRTGIAAIFPSTPYGTAQDAAFRRQMAKQNIQPQADMTFTDPGQVGEIVRQLAPMIRRGKIDVLFLPDRATAPTFGAALVRAGVRPGQVLVVGSAQWAGDPYIAASPGLAGAIYPAIDASGYDAMSPQYQAMFGTKPDRLATIAYTAVVLANARTLSLASPPYGPALMSMPAGFTGRDGVFRFTADGLSDYALVIDQVTPNGPVTIDGPKL